MSYYYPKPYSPNRANTTKTSLLKDKIWTKKELKDGEPLRDAPQSEAVVSVSTSTNAKISPEDCLADLLLPKSITSHLPSNGTISEKDLCTCCHKPVSLGPKMVLDGVKISCHTSCFKCELCNGPLGHLKAGDSVWVLGHKVYCGDCFSTTREKWHFSNE